MPRLPTESISSVGYRCFMAGQAIFVPWQSTACCVPWDMRGPSLWTASPRPGSLPWSPCATAVTMAAGPPRCRRPGWTTASCTRFWFGPCPPCLCPFLSGLLRRTLAGTPRGSGPGRPSPGNHDFRPSPLHYLPGRGMFSLAGGPAGSVPAQGKFLWSQGMQPQRHRTRQYLREHLQILHNFSPNTPFTNPGECTMIAALALERVEC